MITYEMVEAACEAEWGETWERMKQQPDSGNWFIVCRSGMRRALQAAESLRPKMVEVGKMTDAPYIDVEWLDVDFADSLPAGTKLYAEQPK